MLKKIALSGGCAAALIASPAMAQEAGDVYVKVAAARTKLVDKGDIFTNGVQDPADAYETREAFHAVLTAGYFPIDNFSLEASIASPATTNNIPAGALAGLPNLGDDEFVLATVGATFQPFRGRVRPYVGGGLAIQITTQERDGLAVGLNIPNATGPYVNAGVNVGISDRLDVFADVRKAWYTTAASGRLPLDATYTTFAQVDANAQLDPLTIQLGVGARFGPSHAAATDTAPWSDTGNWVVRFGYTNLRLTDKVDLMVGGAPYPGAGLSTFEHQTPTVQIGRFLTRNIAINATIGIPPTIDVYGAGTIGALPKLGKVTYGPTALTVQYHPLRSGFFRPYVGAGLAYMFVFGTKDGAFSDLKVDEDLGPAFEAGVELMVGHKTGVFFDVKKALLRPKAYGTFAGLPVEGQTTLDPWAFTGGLSFHF